MSTGFIADFARVCVSHERSVGQSGTNRLGVHDSLARRYGRRDKDVWVSLSNSSPCSFK